MGYGKSAAWASRMTGLPKTRLNGGPASGDIRQAF